LGINFVIKNKMGSFGVICKAFLVLLV